MNFTKPRAQTLADPCTQLRSCPLSLSLSHSSASSRCRSETFWLLQFTAVLREALLITLDQSYIQWPACGMILPWSKGNWQIKFFPLSVMWAHWAALRNTPEMVVDQSCIQQPACGMMVTFIGVIPKRPLGKIVAPDRR